MSIKISIPQSSLSMRIQPIRTQVYKPMVDQVLQLVKGQIKQVVNEHNTTPKFVLLVGGFGRSQYLRECLQDAIPNKISVLQKRGGDPWAAVVRGAVLHGLSRSGVSDTIVVDSRISRFHYGTLVNKMPFNPVEDDPRDLEYSTYDRAFIAADQTEWFVQIDDSVSAYKPAVYKCHQDLTSREQAIQVDIVTSDSSVAPTRYDDCVKKTVEDGHAFRHIEYDLRMVSDGSSLEFKICYGDQTLASESIMFDSTIQPKEKRGKLNAKADITMKDEPDELGARSEAPPSINDSDDEYVTGIDDNGGESSEDSDSTEIMDCDSDEDDE
ncbi:uncharacterized protein FTOL_03012 [Fusarium torulosum]|uniref:Uncharacterized protein n=1 Tax=Fusarium torulosum TaxID=33205 RepID=A0AAE8M334_9HYPO|nr:uncharacterized protein FTOL_03012 [Fusarium torulosum]